MHLKRLAVLGSIAALFALMVLPSAMAYTGTLTCIAPASCAGGSIAANGPGSTVIAYYFLQSNSPSGTTIHYYVCPVGSSSCSSNTGSSNGWSWSFAPASGTTSSGVGCIGSCEGNGFGSASTLALSITAPSIVNSTNGEEDLIIYACATGTPQANCAGVYQQVASATIGATVPQFTLGIGMALVLGLLGVVLVKKRATSTVPSAFAAPN